MLGVDSADSIQMNVGIFSAAKKSKDSAVTILQKTLVPNIWLLKKDSFTR